jgi:hypothetical protein
MESVGAKIIARRAELLRARLSASKLVSIVELAVLRDMEREARSVAFRGVQKPRKGA